MVGVVACYNVVGTREQCTLTELTSACIVMEGADIFGSMFTFDSIFIYSLIFSPVTVGSSPKSNLIK